MTRDENRKTEFAIQAARLKRNPDGKPYKSVRTAFNNAVSRAKLDDATVHTLRHTFASRLVMAGVDLPTVQKLVGWKTLDMVLRYAHLSPSHLDGAVEKIAKNSQRYPQRIQKRHPPMLP